MAFAPGGIKNYLLSLLHYLGDLTDKLSEYFRKFYSEKMVKEKIGIWEFRLESTINRKDRWIGLVPLITGLIIVFIVMGSGILNWFMLALVFLVIGALIVGQKEEME